MDDKPTFSDGFWTPPTKWPRWMRRTFVLTLPVSLPLYGAYLVLVMACMMMPVVAGAVALFISWIYEEVWKP